ncbi:MAG: diguanylate cyclase [Firmicutes bacterium]|nr:diguanylate cyclase [Bacillota bacterium]
MMGAAEGVSSHDFVDVPDLFIIHDLEGTISYVNHFVLELLGYSPREFLQKNLKEYISPRFLASYSHYLQDITVKEHVREILCVLTKKKQERFLEFNVIVRRQEGGVPQVRGIARDVTERKWAEKALVDVLGRFESIVEYSPLVAIQSFDANGCIYHWNPVSEKLYGMKRRDVLEKPFHELFLQGQEAERFKEDLKQVFEMGQPSDARECPIMTADGEMRWVYFSMFPVREGERCLEAIRMEMDITDRKKVEKELEFLSIHDTLTGLYNRGYFEEEMHRLNTPRFTPVSIIVCDVDNLKPVNDLWGHTEGDVLLQAAAKAVKQPFRSSDVVARIGGDEFAIILPNTSYDTALQACDRIKEFVKQYNDTDPLAPLSLSLGVSTSDSLQHSLMDTFREADRDMYRQKARKAQGLQDSIPRSILSFLSVFFIRGLPLFFNEQAREMALALGEKVGLERDEMSFLSISPQYFPSLHLLWDKESPGEDLQSKGTSRIYRILSIVNAYNTMINMHPYRQAFTHEEAIAEIRRCAGLHLDPELVEKFVELFG